MSNLTDEEAEIYDQWLNAEAADVQPVVYAEWEDTGNFYYKRCSNCKALWDITLVDNRFFNLCPRCGAKLKKRKQ